MAWHENIQWYPFLSQIRHSIFPHAMFRMGSFWNNDHILWSFWCERISKLNNHSKLLQCILYNSPWYANSDIKLYRKIDRKAGCCKGQVVLQSEQGSSCYYVCDVQPSSLLNLVLYLFLIYRQRLNNSCWSWF